MRGTNSNVGVAAGLPTGGGRAVRCGRLQVGTAGAQIALLDVEGEVRLQGVVHVAGPEVQQGDLVIHHILNHRVPDVEEHEGDAAKFQLNDAARISVAVHRVAVRVEELQVDEARVAVDPQHAEALDGRRGEIGPLVKIEHYVPQQNGLKLGGFLRLGARPTENVFDGIVVQIRPLFLCLGKGHFPGKSRGIDEDADTTHNQQVGENLDAEKGVHVQAGLSTPKFKPATADW